MRGFCMLDYFFRIRYDRSYRFRRYRLYGYMEGHSLSRDKSQEDITLLGKKNVKYHYD